MMRHLAPLTAALLSLGCEDKAKLAPPPSATGRTNAIVATNAAATQPAATTTGAAPKAAKPRELCVGQTSRPAPKGAVATAAAPGAAALPTTIPFGAGKWIWLNFWAAWCGPCKEEMPRLLAWRNKLAAAGVLVDLAFVSIDDDERQLRRFIEAQPDGGVRASYWLPEGSARTSFLAALGLKDAPQLPVHALVGPDGRVACMIHGAVEDHDYPAIASFLQSRR